MPTLLKDERLEIEAFTKLKITKHRSAFTVKLDLPI